MRDKPQTVLPRQRQDPLSLAALIGANLIPFAGIFLFDWDVRYIVLLYWVEILIVGSYNIIKMAILKVEPAADNIGKLFAIPFFCVHYGGFCAVHGFFLIHFFNIGSNWSPFAGKGDWWGPLVFIQLLVSVIVKIWSSRPPEMIWAVIGLAISHGVSLVENYLLGGEYKQTSLKKLMRQPYQRIIVMHVAILAGGIFVMKLHSPMPLMIILVLLKIFFDLHLHSKSHRVTPAKTGDRYDATANGNADPPAESHPR